MAINQEPLITAFQGAAYKITWAHKHVANAREILEAYIKSEFIAMSFENDPRTGLFSLCVEAKAFPIEFALSVGDAFHSLSCALDYMMTGMMRVATGTANRVSFPIDETRDTLERTFKPAAPGKGLPRNRRMIEAFPNLEALMLDTIQSYRGGAFKVWEVRKFDNIDKHNMVAPTFDIPSLKIDVANEAGTFASNSTISIRAGSRYYPFHFPNIGDTKLSATQHGGPSFSVKFPSDLDVFAGEEVLPTASECCARIGEVFQTMKDCCIELWPELLTPQSNGVERSRI